MSEWWGRWCEQGCAGELGPGSMWEAPAPPANSNTVREDGVARVHVLPAGVCRAAIPFYLCCRSSRRRHAWRGL